MEIMVVKLCETKEICDEYVNMRCEGYMKVCTLTNTYVEGQFYEMTEEEYKILHKVLSVWKRE